jgi:hypothetical protein
MENKTLVNRVAQSGLITLKPEEFYPDLSIFPFDLKDFLFHGLILKEKDFRAAVRDYRWKDVQDRDIVIFCSADAIIPMWAYMLVVSKAQGKARNIFIGSEEEFIARMIKSELDKVDFSAYQDEKVVIKGCSDIPLPASLYGQITEKLMPYAQSIMYGEPCSTVPIFKRKRKL